MEHEVVLLVRLSLDIAERVNDESACMGLESYRVLFLRAHGSYRVLFLNLLLHLVLVAGMDRLNLLLLLDDLLLLLVDELMIFCWIDISSLVDFWSKGYLVRLNGLFLVSVSFFINSFCLFASVATFSL
jgi:hypothetical protein